jgi:hypothetical protein
LYAGKLPEEPFEISSIELTPILKAQNVIKLLRSHIAIVVLVYAFDFEKDFLSALWFSSIIDANSGIDIGFKFLGDV